jgi:hypothetical protein
MTTTDSIETLPLGKSVTFSKTVVVANHLQKVL